MLYLVLSVILYMNHEYALLLLLTVYGLFIIHGKIILLIRTWSLAWENNATTMVEWDTFNWLIRKASEGLPYPERATIMWGATSIERFSGRSCCDGFSD
jgi:hypothetical protein